MPRANLKPKYYVYMDDSKNGWSPVPTCVGEWLLEHGLILAARQQDLRSGRIHLDTRMPIADEAAILAAAICNMYGHKPCSGSKRRKKR